MFSVKRTLAFVLIFNSLLLASGDTKEEIEKKQRHERNLRAQIQEEKKFAEEQTFYQTENYNFKGSEVNQDSLDSIPDIEVDPFDMTNVYD